MKAFFVALVVLVGVVASFEVAAPMSLIDEVNAKQSLWKASPNKITRMSREEARGLLGVPQDEMQRREEVYAKAKLMPVDFDAAEEFDSRTNWPNCPTISEIRNQRHCGSCWAFGAVESMSDRVCIKTGKNVRLSAEDMNSCSEELALVKCGSCNGGRPGCAWTYWVNKGVVSEDCYAYTAGQDNTKIDTPKCEGRCVNSTTLIWGSDKHHGASHSTHSGEAAFMKEIEANGPMETAFQVYADFYSYSSGVYYHVSGSLEGGHAVRVLGWGTENGVKYWLVANSWDVTWGDKGFFKIKRGNNECTFENEAWSGIAK